MTSDVALAVPFDSICDTSGCENELEEIISTNLLIISNFNETYNVQYNNYLEYILLYDLYKVLAWQQLISQLIGRWSQSEGLINFALPRRTYNMGRTEIKAGIYVSVLTLLLRSFGFLLNSV